MMHVRRRSRRAAPASRLRRSGRFEAFRISTRAACFGLLLVVLALSGFAGISATAIARAAGEARTSSEVRQLSIRAYDSLLRLEDLGDEAVERPSPESRAEYRAAVARAADALADFDRVHGADAPAVRRAMADFSTYQAAVRRMFVIAERRPGDVHRFEERYVDPPYEATLGFVTHEAEQHWQETGVAVETLGRLQRQLLSAWAVLAALALVPIGVFARTLRRHRRAILTQAMESRHQALHDALTGLPNRTLLHQRAESAMQAARRAGRSTGLLIIDLDRFKVINDTLGHHYGDVVLMAMATRLRAALRAEDTVARLGGDEFAVVLHAVDTVEAAMDAAARVRGVIEEVIESDGLTLRVEASVGVVLSGLHGLTVETLMRHADIAMYVAKERGLGACLYDDDLNGHSLARLGLLGELGHAIDTGQLRVHYQPKVSLATGDVHGVEALVRWEHPERGMIRPDEFVPLAEQTALIRRLTCFVLDTSLGQCRTWREAGRDVRVAVNISARNLLDDHFVSSVQQLLAKWRLEPSCLELEITESAVVDDPRSAQATLGVLDRLGVTLAIDDFGVGFTSLAHLRNLPVHVLKIDQSFVSRIVADRRDAAIVRSLVELAHELGLVTVAEGVEDRRTLDALAALGCDVAQGFHLGRPVPAAQLDEWLDDWFDERFDERCGAWPATVASSDAASSR
jgi:diguanylate cyclase (GGDEF)-like protein